MTDFTIDNHGSIFILTPLTDDGDEWVSQHIPEDAMRWGRYGIVVEARYIDDIVEGIRDDGLIL
jgi:hypothetical protein